MKGEPKRRALGKGLGSLIPDFSNKDPLNADGSTAAGVPAEIPIAEIDPNPQQPRQNFNIEEIESLASSIKSSGILQPLLVRQEKNGRYTLIAGERRLRAAKLAGLETVPAVLRDLEDERMLEIALIENIQRDDLGPIETAAAFRQLIRRHRLTQNEVSERVGKPRSTVANYLRLLDLPDAVQQLLEEGQLDMGHARALAGLSDEREQLRLAKKAAASDWTVRRVEEQVRKLRGEGDAESTEQPRKDPNVVAAEESLARALGARVGIQTSKSGRGKIEIRFADEEDLERLYAMLVQLEGR